MPPVLRVFLAACLALAADALAQPSAAALDAAVAPFFQAEAPGGAVIVAKAGKTVFARGYGLADLEQKIAVKPDMPFRIGSITKQFTAAAILMLEKDGKLAITDDVAKYLPEVPKAERTTTIEHLLNQTSGLANYTEFADFPPPLPTGFTTGDMVAYAVKQPRLFQPGEQYRYSNTNYLLLAAIIERVSGKKYAEFMAARLFEPLQLAATAHDGFERGGHTRVEGYNKALGGPFTKATTTGDLKWPSGAGALVSSVEDLAAWNDALVKGRVIAGAWQRMSTPARLADGKPTKYGYGLIVDERLGKRIVWHNGGIDGFRSIAAYYPDDDVYFAVLLNSTGGIGPTTVFDRLVAAYFR